MTANRQHELKSVAVFGGGLVALSAALAIARTSPRTRVSLIRTPPDPGALADRLPATLPASGGMLDRLGLSGDQLTAGGAAVHRLGERFNSWGRSGSDWAQGFGTAAPIGAPGVPHQLWLTAAGLGSRTRLSELFPASLLVERSRYVEASNGRSLLSHAEPGFRLSPERLVPVLSELARCAGVQSHDGEISVVERASDGSCDAVTTSRGDRITADLYVDASGPVATLSARMGARSIDWCHLLPADRLLLGRRTTPATPADDYTAIDLGWRAVWSSGDHALTGIGFNGAIDGEARARRVAGDAAGTAELVTVRPGRLALPWTHNVLALGDAACVMGPLGTAGLALAHLHLELLLELWPSAGADPLLVAEYNRRATLRADRLRDWVAALYLVEPRRSSGFWQTPRGAEIPDGLATTLLQFDQRGLVAHHEEDSFSRDDWAQRLLHLGMRPRRPDPIAASANPGVLAAALARTAAATNALADSLPPYPAYLAALSSRRQH